MPRVVHISDTHLDAKSTRFEQYKRVLGDDFRHQVSEYAPDVIVHTGDLAGQDAPHRLVHTERSFIAKWVRSLSRIAPVVIVRGNHDSLHELEIFTRCSAKYPITVITEPRRFDVVGRSKRPISIGAVPWMPRRVICPDLDKMVITEAVPALKAALNEIVTQNCRGAELALLHFGVAGAELTESVLQSPYDVVLEPGFLTKLKAGYVALGHFHKHQKVTANAAYAGSSVPLSFGEPWAHGYVTCDDTGIQFRRLESWSVQKFSVDVNGGKILTNLDERVREIIPDADVKVYLNLLDGITLPVYEFERIRSLIKAAGGVPHSTPNVRSAARGERNIQLTQHKTELDALREYLKHKGLQETEVISYVERYQEL